MENLQRAPARDAADVEDFSTYLMVAHYYANRAACLEQHNLVSLLWSWVGFLSSGHGKRLRMHREELVLRPASELLVPLHNVLVPQRHQAGLIAWEYFIQRHNKRAERELNSQSHDRRLRRAFVIKLKGYKSKSNCSVEVCDIMAMQLQAS